MTNDAHLKYIIAYMLDILTGGMSHLGDYINDYLKWAMVTAAVIIESSEKLDAYDELEARKLIVKAKEFLKLADDDEFWISIEVLLKKETQ